MPPEVQGAALAELVAIFVAGHHPCIRDDSNWFRSWSME
jgi:hypothetical protein